jgi:hypothetical protein
MELMMQTWVKKDGLVVISSGDIALGLWSLNMVEKNSSEVGLGSCIASKA